MIYTLLMLYIYLLIGNVFPSRQRRDYKSSAFGASSWIVFCECRRKPDCHTERRGQCEPALAGEPDRRRRRSAS
jgi:hypothetical protein